MTIRTTAQVNVDRVLAEHGLGKATPLSYAIVDAFLATVTSALRELAPDLIDDVAHGNSPVSPIEDLNLSDRAYNCLKREGVHTLGDVLAHSALPRGLDSLHKFRNLDPKQITEVLLVMNSLGVEHPDLTAAQTQDWWIEP